jgi:hypothetical protein
MLRQQLDRVAAELTILQLPTVRCSVCGRTLYCGPNGCEPGDRCGAPIPPEYIAPHFQLVRRTCHGTLMA